MRIAVLCACLPSYNDLGLYTIDLNKKPYCERHGYHLEVVRSIRPKFQDPNSHAGGISWSRLEHMAEMVESGNWDWVWVVGCDTLVTNMTIKLESIIAMSQTPEAEALPLPIARKVQNSPAPPEVIKWVAPENHVWTGKKHLLICGECVVTMQADSFLVRGSPEGSAYLRDIIAQYELYKHHVWVENQTMIDLRDKHAAITYMVPQWKLNAIDVSRWHSGHPVYRENLDCYGNRGQWQPGDFIIHWPAASLEERLQWLNEYTPKIVH